MKIVLASHNTGKLAELQQLLAPLGLTLISQAELGLSPAEEPFNTFVENALVKARHASRASGLPALADDAGLCVDAWGGRPGVHTAHYASDLGYAPGDDNNVNALLANMAHLTQPSQRRAALVSTLVAVRNVDDPEPLIACGRVVGQIAPEPLGEHGFGFDPVMLIPELGLTFAQLPVEVKNARSHRGQAAQQMIALMRERWLS